LKQIAASFDIQLDSNCISSLVSSILQESDPFVVEDLSYFLKKSQSQIDYLEISDHS
jgi:hypothetical protein